MNSTWTDGINFLKLPVSHYMGQLQYVAILLLSINRFTSIVLPIRHKSVRPDSINRKKSIYFFQFWHHKNVYKSLFLASLFGLPTLIAYFIENYSSWTIVLGFVSFCSFLIKKNLFFHNFRHHSHFLYHLSTQYFSSLCQYSYNWLPYIVFLRIGKWSL